MDEESAARLRAQMQNTAPDCAGARALREDERCAFCFRMVTPDNPLRLLENKWVCDDHKACAVRMGAAR